MKIELAGMEWKRAWRGFMPCLISANGTHKVVRYGAGWFAFFMPAGWKNFGNSVSLEHGKSKAYQTMRDAMTDCAKHAELYPRGAKSDNRL
jgi:hypothetical protein